MRITAHGLGGSVLRTTTPAPSAVLMPTALSATAARTLLLGWRLLSVSNKSGSWKQIGESGYDMNILTKRRDI